MLLKSLASTIFFNSDFALVFPSYTYARTHTHTHTHTHSLTHETHHTHTHTNTNIHTHTHTHTYTQSCMTHVSTGRGAHEYERRSAMISALIES